MNIAIYTNILTPYRVYFYDLMYKECVRQGDKFNILLMADTEPNRNWKYDDYKTDYTILLKHRTISFGETYIHYNSNLLKSLKELELDIIVCAGSYLCPGIWSVLKYEKKLGYKTYFWSESHLNESRKYNGIKIKIRDILRNNIYKKFDGFWYAGEMSRQFIETYCSSDSEFYFMPNLVEEEKYKAAGFFSAERKKEIRKKYGINENRIIFVCPARLSSVKGIDCFLPLFAKARNKNNVTILIAGDGELREKIALQAEEYNLDVRLLGFKNQESIIELYSISDYFLLPSLSDPNPLTCIEALWARLPLFISEHCGNYPEVIEQGVNGFSFSYDNEVNTINNLEKIISAETSWKNHAREVSYKIACTKFKSKDVVFRILQDMKENIK